MHVDLVEALRCPRGHEDGWLVAATDVVVDRRILRGTIGCPVCGAEWRVEDGELDLVFDASAESDAAPPARPVRTHIAPPANVHGSGARSAESDYSADALRLAALLDLRDARGAVALCGEAARVADALESLTGVVVLAVNAPAGCAQGHSRLRVMHSLPLGVGTVRGVVLDALHGAAEWLMSAVRAVERGGRIVAPAQVAVPEDLKELARDERQWVAEVRVAASGLVPLRRRGDPLA